MIYVTSDQHFFHKNIIKYCNRPFKNVDEMNETLVENYNNTVNNDDAVIFLGDIALIREYNLKNAKKILNSLKGQKILLLGNHDANNIDIYRSCGFFIGKYIVIDDIFFSHYPLFGKKCSNSTEKTFIEIFKSNKAKYIVHGHNHNNYSDDPLPEWPDGIKRFNASVEVNDYKPIDIKTIFEAFKT